MVRRSQVWSLPWKVKCQLRSLKWVQLWWMWGQMMIIEPAWWKTCIESNQFFIHWWCIHATSSLVGLICHEMLKQREPGRATDTPFSTRFLHPLTCAQKVLSDLTNSASRKFPLHCWTKIPMQIHFIGKVRWRLI